MHELAIAKSIVQTVTREMERNHYVHVSAVGLRIGGLSDVVQKDLSYGFESLTRGTPLEHTRLEMETVPIRGRCKTCRQEIAIEKFLFVCPICGGSDIAMIQGAELDIAYLEVGDDDDSPDDPRFLEL